MLKNDGENSVMKAIIDYFGKNAKTRVVDKEGFRAAVRVCVRDEDLNKNKYVNSFYYAVTRNPSLNKQLDALQAEYDQIKHAKGIGSPRIIVIRKEISKIRSQIWEQECCYVSDVSIVAAKLFEKQAINLIDLSGCYCAASKNADNSRFNILSAFISFAAAVKTEPNVQNVSIITPYAAQTRLIWALELDYQQHGDTEIRCATVHQFQGSESDVIFFDAVESYLAKKPGWLMGKDFNSIQRLINVAVTRAKGKLITVANSRFWNNNYTGTQHTFYKLVQNCINF